MLTLREWLAFDGRRAHQFAEAVARRVGGALVDVGWPRTPRASVRPSRVARFDVGGDEFVLVPGGEAVLGYDAERFRPSDDEVRSFDGDHDALRPADDHGREETPPDGPLDGQLPMFPSPRRRKAGRRGEIGRVRAYVARRVTSPRRVTVPTLLVAVDAVEAGVVPTGADHLLVRAHLARVPWAPGVKGRQGDGRVSDDHPGTFPRVEFDPTTGVVLQCWLAGPASLSSVALDLAERGRRLPTADEWEYGWGLGPQTLFPWGDRFLASPGQETVTGLRFGEPHWPELTSELGEVRAGDYGAAGHGGATRFFHALLQAPAYRDPDVAGRERLARGVRRRRYRPVIEVGD